MILARSSARGRVTLLVILALAAVLPFVLDEYGIALATYVCIFAVAAMSLDLLVGYTGMLSMGHAALMGVSAYALGWGLGQGFGHLAGIGVAFGVLLLVLVAFGAVAVKVSGLTFAILTLALGQILWGLAFRWVKVTGGDNGLIIPSRPAPFGIDLNDSKTFYLGALVVVVLAWLVMRMIVSSPYGLVLRGIRDDEHRMASLGYNVTRHKFSIYVISGLIAGVAGLMIGYFNFSIGPTSLDFARNGNLILMVILGGGGTLFGPILGAAALVGLEQYVSIFTARWPMIQGAVFVLAIMFAPKGIWGLFETLRKKVRGTPTKKREKALVQ